MPEFPNEALPPVSPVQMADTSDDGQKAFVTRHMDRFSSWAAWRKPMEGLWAEIYRLYVGVGKGTKHPTRAKVMIPVVFQIIEAALPKIVSIIFGMAEWFSMACPSGNLEERALDGLHKLVMRQMKLVKFFRKFVDFGKQLMLYGTSYFFVYWKVKREWVWTRSRVNTPTTIFGIPLPFQNVQWQKTLEYKVVERRPEVEVLPIENVFPDPDAGADFSSRGVYVVSFSTLADLKAQSSGKYPVYTNIDKLEEMGEQEQQKQDFTTQKASIRGVSQSGEAGKSKDQVELITFWGREDLDGDGIPEEVQLVFANRAVLIKAIRNPFEHQMRPVITCNLFPVPHEHYGVGLVEPIIPLVHELTTIRNQNIDMNNLIINRMWKVSSLADVDMDTLIARPNGVVLTDQMDGVEPLVQPEIPYSPREMAAVIQSDIENATAPKSVQGTPDNSTLGRTARGAQLIVSQALEKFGTATTLIEEVGIRTMLDQVYRLNRQFLDTPEMIAEFYPEVAETVTPDTLSYDVEFKLLGVNETVTKEAAMNQISSFLALFKDVPGVDLLGVARAYWNRMGLNIPAEDVIATAPIAQQVAVGAVTDPQVSGGAEQAILAQSQQNGGGQMELPQP